ncbi:hypothetical protein [Weissella cibaria]|uniref:hypothetical protein n=1 Tax=Weissella cibaria TaxID=137591 RepID=UPI00189FAF50|nr:hypothetical protein [Weissella cibaria]MCG4286510.1 hypothetical protein [Weissella cibaria]
MKTIDTDLVEIKDSQVFGTKELLTELQSISAFDVSSNTELTLAKKKRAAIAKVVPALKKQRKAFLTDMEQQLNEQYPELPAIEELAVALIEDFDKEIKPYVTSIKGDRLERIQSTIDEISANYGQETYQAPTEYANEEYWTQTNNPAKKLEKKIVDDVRLRQIDMAKVEAKLDSDKRKAERLKDAIRGIINNVDRVNGIYSGEDVIKLLMPIGEFIKE